MWYNNEEKYQRNTAEGCAVWGKFYEKDVASVAGAFEPLTPRGALRLYKTAAGPGCRAAGSYGGTDKDHGGGFCI